MWARLHGYPSKCIGTDSLTNQQMIARTRTTPAVDSTQEAMVHMAEVTTKTTRRLRSALAASAAVAVFAAIGVTGMAGVADAAPATGPSPTCSTSFPAGAKTVGMATTATGNGYWLVDQYGDVVPFGGAECHGSLAGMRLAAPIVGIAADTQSGGYWLVGADGGVFSFDAPFQGSNADTNYDRGGQAVGISYLPDSVAYALNYNNGVIAIFGGSPGSFKGEIYPTKLNAPIVGPLAFTSRLTSGGRGYWQAGADGGVFSFGSATFYGSIPGTLKPGQHLAAPIVAMAADTQSGGYWLVGADGGVFSFHARFHGSIPGVLKPGQHLNGPIVGMAEDPATGGYWLVGATGGVFSFDAPFYGSLG